MEVNRGDLAKVTLQWSLMDWVSGTQFYRGASYVSSVVCVAQWIQEGESHAHKIAFYAGTLERFGCPGRLSLARSLFVLALTGTDRVQDLNFDESLADQHCL
jgi:hypothetical protein